MNFSPEPLDPKKDLGRFSATCFIYSIVMVVVVLLYTVLSFLLFLPQQGFDLTKTEETVTTFMDSDGGAYLLASSLGVLIFTIFRGKRLFTQDFRKKNKRMTGKVFFFMICFLFFAQLFGILTSQLMDIILSIFGLNLSEILSQDFSSTTVTMFLYSTIMAPITEEIIFRGAGLRALEKYGKVFAILMTSIIFGLFHENLSQLYFASFIGLGLGYIAFEYSIYWSIFFHIFNNLVIAEGLDFLSRHVPTGIVNLIDYSLMLGASTVIVLLLILKWPTFKEYIAANLSYPGTYRRAFKSVWFWVFSILSFLTACLPVVVAYLLSKIDNLP